MTGRTRGSVPAGLSRRRILALAGAGVASWWAGACRPGPELVLNPFRAEELGGEAGVLALLASLDNLAISAYDLARERLAELREEEDEQISPAILEAVAANQEHHRTHADTWNALLVELGLEPITERNLTYKASLDIFVRLAISDRGMAGTVMGLEQVLGATGLVLLGDLDPGPVFDAVAAIAPVEMAHSSVIGQLAGSEPVPDTFVATLPARPLTDILG